MIKKITYANKAPFQTLEEIPNENKVRASDMNEIKSAVNNNADELEMKQPKEQGKGLSTNDFTNELKNKLENLNNYDDGEITSKVTKLEENVVKIQKEQTTQNKDIEYLQTDNEKNKTDLQTIKQEQQEQNTKIENNITQNEEQADLLNQIVNILPTTTSEGEYVTLQDTAEIKFKKFEVQGNSKQKTRSGKNVLDINSSEKYIQQCSAEVNIDKMLISTTNTNSNAYVSIPLKVKPQTDYSVAGTAQVLLNEVVETGSSYIRIREFNNSGAWVSVQSIINSNITSPQNVDFKFNSGDYTTVWIWFYMKPSATTGTRKINFTKIQVEEVVATEYEQYGASPSPEYPSKIRNLGDNINLFNKEILENNKYIEATNGTVGNSNGTSASDYIDIKGLKQIISSGDGVLRGNGGAFYNASKQYISGFPTSEIVNGIDIPETASYVRITATTEKLNGIKIEEGKQVTPYSPYNCGNTKVTVCNKNLYDNKNANVLNSPIDSNGIGTNAGDTYKTIYIPCKPNTTYTVSKLYDATKNRFALAYTNTEPTYSMKVEGYISNANVSNLTITTGKNAKYLLAYVWITGGTNTYQEMLSSIQIEKNAEATKKIEHKQQKIVFPLSEGQRLMKGDYLAKDGIHHVRKQIVLDGTKVFQIGTNGTNITTQRFYMYEKSIKANGDIACNYLKQVYKGSTDIFRNDVEGCNISNGQHIQIKINKEIASTVDELHEWIKQEKNEGNPLIFECELAEEEIEPYTPEQQKAYDEIQNLKSYYGQTNIFSEDEVSPIFKVKARNDIGLLLSGMNQTILEGSN